MTQSLIKLYELLNTDQYPKPAFTEQNVVLEDVQPVVGSNFNTQVTVRAVEGQGYEGTGVATYRRLNLAFLLAPHNTQDPDTITTPQELLDALNQATGAWLELADLDTFTIPTAVPGEEAQVLLKAKADSFGFHGESTITLRAAVVLAVDVTDAVIEVESSNLHFRDTYEGAAGSIVGRVPQAGTYDTANYGAEWLPPLVEGGVMKCDPATHQFGIDALFDPVTAASGVVSLKVLLRNYQSTHVIEEMATISLGLATTDNENGLWAWSDFAIRGRKLELFNGSTEQNAIVEWPVPIDPSELMELEIRWDLATGDFGAFVNGVRVHTVAGTGPVAAPIGGCWAAGYDVKNSLFESIEVTSGAAPLEINAPAQPLAMTWYSSGLQDGLWWGLSNFTWFTAGEAPLPDVLAAKVLGAANADVDWTAEWFPVPSNTSGGVPTLAANRGPDPSLLSAGGTGNDPAAVYPLAAWVDQSTSGGRSVGVLRIKAKIDNVDVPVYVYAGLAYQNPTESGYSDVPYTVDQYTTTFVDIGFTGAPAVVPPTVLIRDDFNGTAGTNFVGRIPNISVDGHAYSDLSDGSGSELLLDGNGNVYASEGPQQAAYGFLVYDTSSAMRFEMSMRNADGVSPLARNFDAIFAVQMRSTGAGQNLRRADFDLSAADSLYMYSPEGGEATPAYTDPLGAGGAAVKFTFEWGNGHLKYFINDALQADLTITAAGEPQGPGYLYVEFEPGNKVDYIQLSQLP
ncbi:hypothetical protein D3C71_79550 [compost metagenome]